MLRLINVLDQTKKRDILNEEVGDGVVVGAGDGVVAGGGVAVRGGAARTYRLV